MKADIRRLALSFLEEQEAAGKYINLALSSHSADTLSKDERASLTALLYTTVERRITYDYIISALSEREIEKINPRTRNILRIGLCQLIDMRSIPDFAAVNETVKLASNPGERAFINGVLRAASRRLAELPMPSEEKNYKRYLSVKYSFPLWIVKHFDRLFGREETERMLAFYNGEKYTDITVNSLKTTPEKLLSDLASLGLDAKQDQNTPLSIRLKRSVNPESIPGFSDGHFFVQDKASLVSAYALGAEKGNTVIDTCSAPGGKSFASSVLMGGEGSIRAYDIHESKLSLIESGADRLGLHGIIAEARDALEPNEALFGKADRVICDAPCSGLGVLGKKPDLRYKDKESVSELPALQYSILKESSKYLKLGGYITYSTCTLNPAENEEIAERFLSENKGFEYADFKVGALSSKVGCLTLLPHVHHTDGFFIAKFKRIK